MSLDKTNAYASMLSNDAVDIKQFMREGAFCACGNLRKAVRAVTQLYDEALRPVGLRASQLALLSASNSLGTPTMSRLAKFMVMDPTTLTRNLSPLQKQELIRIKPGKDRREREVTVTGRGVQVLAKAYPAWRKAQAHVINGLGNERMSQLLADLSAVVGVTQGR